MKEIVHSLLIAFLCGYLNFAVSATETVYLYNFDDETAGACDGTATDSGSASPNNATLSNYTNATWELLGGYNNYMGLTCGTTVDGTAKMTTASVISWGSKFVLEAKVWKGSGQIDLVKTADGTTLKWYIDSDGKIHLEMSDGTNSANVVTTYPVVYNSQWTTVCAVVDLTQSTYSTAVKFYVNPADTIENVSAPEYAFAYSTYSSIVIPEYAFDEVYSTRWLSQMCTSMSGVVYIGQDFGEGNEKHIRYITFRQVVGTSNDNYAVASFKVQRSSDNTTWTDVATISTPTDNGLYYYELPVSGASRYWRLANAQALNNYWQVRDIEMREAIQVPTLASTSTYTSGINLPSTNLVDMLQRSAAFTLKCDYVKIAADASFTTYDTANFYVSDFTNYIKSGSSSAVIVDPSTLLKRVTNPASDFTNGVPNSGVTVAYDSHPTTPSVFYGIFEFNFQLDKTSFDGAVTVDIYIKKPEDENFKKIGQITATEPESGDWIVKYYWNSRAAAYDWTSTDAQPYRTDGQVKFKFNVR